MKDNLTRNRNTVYGKLKEDLRSRITGGKLKPGEALHGENELSRRYGISRMSVRNALTELVREGLIITLPGKGSFVADRNKKVSGEVNGRRVAFIVPNVEDLVTSEIYRGVEEIIRKRGYSPTVFGSNRSIERETANLKLLLEKKETGAIIFPNWGRANSEAIFELKKEGYPFVLVDKFFRDIETDYVVTDNVDGAYQAVEHLIKLGHKRIGHIAGLESTANEDRLEGYRLALGRHKLVYEPELIKKMSGNGFKTMEPENGGYDEMHLLLSLKEKPTAVFASNDYLAIGIMKAIKEAGLNVPDDIAVAGFDDLKFSASLEIPLTTVAQPFRDIGEKAAKILLNKIEGANSQNIKKIVLKPKLIVRKSCGAHV